MRIKMRTKNNQQQKNRLRTPAIPFFSMISSALYNIPRKYSITAELILEQASKQLMWSLVGYLVSTSTILVTPVLKLCTILAISEESGAGDWNQHRWIHRSQPRKRSYHLLSPNKFGNLWLNPDVFLSHFDMLLKHSHWLFGVRTRSQGLEKKNTYIVKIAANLTKVILWSLGISCLKLPSPGPMYDLFTFFFFKCFFFPQIDVHLEIDSFMQYYCRHKSSSSCSSPLFCTSD